MRILLLITLLAFAPGCTDRNNDGRNYEGEEDHNNQQDFASRAGYLALGDSYTIGEGVAEDERWPVQLARAISKDTLKVDPVHIVAQTGWTTSDLLNGITQENLKAEYDMVSLLIGVNNQYQGLDPQIYRTEFDSLLQIAVNYAGGLSEKVFVLSIPDYGVTPFASSRDSALIRKEIDRYNEMADSICDRYGVPFFNITPISREALTDRSLLAPDNLHPSGKQYGLWVEAIEDSVTTILER